MKYFIQMASHGMIYLPSFIKISLSIQVIVCSNFADKRRSFARYNSLAD
jgi:hypothetical protein